MEVHHHPHSSPKRFKHYLFEFLMLFLAVFCGFIAENLREHSVEKKRARQYMRSLVQDLQLDITQLEADGIYRKWRETIIDSAILLLHQPDLKQHTSQLYFYAHRINWGTVFIYTDRTMQQLKNSGALRLIENPSLSDSIAFFDMEIRHIQINDQAEKTADDNYVAIRNKVFNGFVFESMVADTSLDHPNSSPTPYPMEAYVVRPPDNPPLITYDINIINELVNQLHIMKYASIYNSQNQRLQIQKMFRLVAMIKKEYHLK